MVCWGGSIEDLLAPMAAYALTLTLTLKEWLVMHSPTYQDSTKARARESFCRTWHE